jgi:response regulator RpfG family c-di-GMP phosphodiesterase
MNYLANPELKILVVDDKPDNLDLLYRTFHRNYKVFRAESGLAALEILAREGEVAVIIFAEPMPEMSVLEFLRRTAVQYPDTSRIMLISYTQDFYEANNSDQVFHWLCLPWNPEELRDLVSRLVDNYTFLKSLTNKLRQRERAEQERLRADSADRAPEAEFQAKMTEIRWWLRIGWSAEQVAEALGLSVEEVTENAGG